MSHPGQHASTRPDEPALIRASDGESLSWGALHRASVAAANHLHDLGLKRGSAVAICLENRFEFVAFVWGAQYAGYRYTPISTRLGPDEISYIVSDCEAEALVVSEQTRCEAVRNTAADMLPVLSVDELELLSAPPQEPAYERAEGISMLYSSGTTGRPKGVFRPAPEAPIEEIPIGDVMMGKLCQLEPGSVYLSTAPLYHTAPLSFLILMSRLGVATVIMERFDAADSLALIERHQVTHSQWVPTMFVRLLRLPKEMRAAHDLSSHRFALHGAAPCPIEVKEQILEWWGSIVHEYYAGTEGAGTCVIGPEDWLTHKGSVGRPAGGVIHISNEAGEDLPVGEVGEVWFESTSTFQYYKDEEKTRSARRAGRATFGDLGYVDRGGFLYLTDRKAFTMIIGGVNVYPQEAEDTLITHPSVFDAAVFGIPHAEYGEEVKGVVQLVEGVEGDAATESALLDFCQGKLAKIKCPRSIDFIAELPRHPTGKLYKRKLRDTYLARGAE